MPRAGPAVRHGEADVACGAGPIICGCLSNRCRSGSTVSAADCSGGNRPSAICADAEIGHTVRATNSRAVAATGSADRCCTEGVNGDTSDSGNNVRRKPIITEIRTEIVNLAFQPD